MNMLTEIELKEIRGRLLEKIERLQEQGDATTGERSIVVLDQQSVGRLSRMDALQQQAMANATHLRRKTEIMRTKSAIARLDEGEFGYCTDCGEKIASARLKHDPSLPLCLDCAKAL